MDLGVRAVPGRFHSEIERCLVENHLPRSLRSLDERRPEHFMARYDVLNRHFKQRDVQVANKSERNDALVGITFRVQPLQKPQALLRKRKECRSIRPLAGGNRRRLGAGFWRRLRKSEPSRKILKGRFSMHGLFSEGYYGDLASRSEDVYRRLVLGDHVRFVERAIRDMSANGSILDVGCGGGLLLRPTRIDHCRDGDLSKLPYGDPEVRPSRQQLSKLTDQFASQLGRVLELSTVKKLNRNSGGRIGKATAGMQNVFANVF